MLNKLKFPVSVITVILILSFNINPREKEIKKIQESSAFSPYDTISDNLASLISGMPFNNQSSCYSKVVPMTKWTHYSRDLDSLFSYSDATRFSKMKIWADSELIRNNTIKTVFYPFSGPDLLNANIFYPDADQYILVAMEPIGSLPDFCKMTPDSVMSYLNTINNSLKDIFKRSYFITSKMDKDLRKNKVNGTIPLISLFIKRTGHNIVSMKRIGIDSLGNWQTIEGTKYKKGIVPGVKIDFQSNSKEKVQSVIYFRTDISDNGLAKNKGFRKYLTGLPLSYTYLKAGSYLMHFDEFKEIRSIIFDRSSTILQDDSGIAYKYFDKSKWDIKLYGIYSKPIDEFSYISEPDLEKAYKNSVFRPLPYKLGYNWRSDHINMLYAIKK